MQINMFYLCRDGGDGSASVNFFFSEEHAQTILDHDSDDYSYGCNEGSVGCKTIKVPEGRVTLENIQTPLTDVLEKTNYSNDVELSRVKKVLGLIPENHKQNVEIFDNDDGNKNLPNKLLTISEVFGNVEVVNRFFWYGEKRGDFSVEKFWAYFDGLATKVAKD